MANVLSWICGCSAITGDAKKVDAFEYGYFYDDAFLFPPVSSRQSVHFTFTSMASQELRLYVLTSTMDDRSAMKSTSGDIELTILDDKAITIASARAPMREWVEAIPRRPRKGEEPLPYMAWLPPREQNAPLVATKGGTTYKLIISVPPAEDSIVVVSPVLFGSPYYFRILP